jgi:hypothetical protein
MVGIDDADGHPLLDRESDRLGEIGVVCDHDRLGACTFEGVVEQIGSEVHVGAPLLRVDDAGEGGRLRLTAAGVGEQEPDEPGRTEPRSEEVLCWGLGVGERSGLDVGSEVAAGDVDQRIGVDGAQERVLPLMSAITRVSGLDVRREIADQAKVIARYQGPGESLKVHPLVGGPLDRAAVEVQRVDVNVGPRHGAQRYATASIRLLAGALRPPPVPARKLYAGKPNWDLLPTITPR